MNKDVRLVRNTLGFVFFAALSSTPAHADVKESVASFCDLQKRQLTDEVEILKDNMQRANSFNEADLSPSIQGALQLLEKDRQTIARGCSDAALDRCPDSAQFRRALLQEMNVLNHKVVQGYEISPDSQERNSFARFRLTRNGTSVHMGFDPLEFLTNPQKERFVHFYTDGQQKAAAETAIYFDQFNHLQLNVTAPDPVSAPASLAENIPACKQTSSWIHQTQWAISARLMKLGERVGEAISESGNGLAQGNASQ
jgi:hypothetical protein